MPYSRFKPSQLILRDELAIDRTFLANERTLMAYLRSGVSLLIAGVTIIHFSSTDWFGIIGLACIPGGIATSAIGVMRYRKMNKRIKSARNQSTMEGAANKNAGQARPNKPQKIRS